MVCNLLGVRVTVLSDDRLAMLTDTILSAALDSSRWQTVLDDIAAEIPGARLHMLGIDSRTGISFDGTSAQYDPAFVESYMAYYNRVNPRTLALKHSVVGVPTVNDFGISFDELRRTEFYADWLLPQEDCHRGGGVVLAQDPQCFVYLGADFRARDGDRNEAHWLALLGRLMPFLRHSLEVNRVLARKSMAEMPDGRQVEDAALLVLGPKRRILFANPEAEALLTDGAVLRRDLLNRLAFSVSAQPGGRGLLDHEEMLLPGVPRQFCVAGPGGRKWDVAIMPLRQDNPALQPFRVVMDLKGSNLVVIVAPASDQLSGEDAIALHLGVTQAEAAVCALLYDGRTIDEIAERRKVSPHTVRNQIKSVLAKVGLRRQTDLIRRIAVVV